MRNLLLAASLLLTASVSAQNLTSYMLNDIDGFNTPAMPQFLPKYSFSLHLPTLGMSNTSQPLNPRAYYAQKDGKTVLDLEALAGDVKDNNFIYNRYALSPIGATWRKNNFYLSLGYSFKQYLYLDYNRAAVEVPVFGNANYVGQTAQLRATLDAGAYHDIAFGLGYQFDKWTIGANIHYLNGIANASTAQNQIDLTTNSDIYQLTLATDLRVNTSNLPEVIIDSLDVQVQDQKMSYGLSNNHGVALDLGITYRMNDKWTFYAGLQDLGSIYWRNNTNNYTSKTNLQFNGIDVTRVIFGDTISVQSLLDSFALTLNPTTTKEGYMTNLSPQATFSANYNYNSKWNFGAVAAVNIYNTRVIPAVALGARYTINKHFKVGATYSYKNLRADNLGLNVTANFGPVQLFALSDNIINLFRFDKGNMFHAQAGATLYFGNLNIDEMVSGRYF